MINSNFDLLLLKKSECVDDYGRRIKECNEWEDSGLIRCVVQHQKVGALAGIQRQIEVEHEVEVVNFAFDSQEQDSPMPQPERGDYLGYYMNENWYLYKIRRVRWTPIFNFGNEQCVTYDIEAERNTPRECPKPLQQRFTNDKEWT